MRIGRIDAIHIGIDKTRIRFQRRRQGHSRQIRPSPPKRRHVGRFIDALKSCHNRNHAISQGSQHPLRIDTRDPSFGMGTIRDNANLPPSERFRFDA